MSEDKVFDIEAALERVEKDGELLVELYEIFFEDFEEQMNSLHEAIEVGKRGTVENITHSLKSALGNLGAMACFKAALALEKAGREGDTETWPALAKELQVQANEFRAVFSAKREEISSISG